MPERTPVSIAKKVVFRAFLASDGKTPATGKTIAITISKNGATSFSNPAAGATNATEMASGFYKFDLGTGDTDTKGPLAWRGAQADINDAGDVYEVVNATNAGFTGVPDVAAGANGGLPTGDASGRVTVGAIASGVIAAATFAANALDAVWSTATRVLTAGTNIALAKGTGVTGFNDLSAAQVKAEADTALADAGVTSARQAHLDADVSSRLASSNYTAPLDAGGVRTAVGLASANLDTQLDALPTAAELTTALASADDATLAAIAALSIPTVSAIASGILAAAATTPIAADVQRVNTVDLTGSGTSGAPWGPA